jgi:hypothetical protein
MIELIIRIILKQLRFAAKERMDEDTTLVHVSDFIT